MMEEQHLDILQCPACRGELSERGGGYRCEGCETEYQNKNDQLDFRLQSPKSYELNFEVDDSLQSIDDVEFGMGKNTSSDVDWSQLDEVPHRLDKTLLSHFPKAPSADSKALDLGCGTGIHRSVCERAGYDWIGVDPVSDGARVLADGQALPFEDDSFDFAISIAVLQLVPNPFVVLHELQRVLRPGARFIGTAAFLEPDVVHNHFHFAPLGLVHALTASGFTVEGLEPGWHVLDSLAHMSLFPKLPNSLSKTLLLPIKWLHEKWYKVGYSITKDSRASEEYRRVTNAGSLKFVARCG